MVVIVITFLKRKNSGVQTAPKSCATSCVCIKISTKYQCLTKLQTKLLFNLSRWYQKRASSFSIKML